MAPVSIMAASNVASKNKELQILCQLIPVHWWNSSSNWVLLLNFIMPAIKVH